MNAGPTGSLFGSVTPLDIADKIWDEAKIRVDRRKIQLPESIKRIGRYEIAIGLFDDVTANVRTLVVPEGGELPPEEPEAPAEAETPAEEPVAEAAEQPVAEAAEEDVAEEDAEPVEEPADEPVQAAVETAPAGCRRPSRPTPWSRRPRPERSARRASPRARSARLRFSPFRAYAIVNRPNARCRSTRSSCVSRVTTSSA